MMMKRQIDAANYNHPQWNIELYDLLRNFAEKNGVWPHNTYFTGNNFGKGYIGYNKLVGAIEALPTEDKEILFQSSTYNLSVRKIFYRVEDVFILLETIHYKKSDNFLSLSEEELENDNILVVGNVTVLHKEPVINEATKALIESCMMKIEDVPMIGIISRDQSGFFLTEVRMETKISHDLTLHYGESFPKFHEALVEKLASTNKGLTLLHGDPGTGKSSYIRKLIFDLKEKTNKKVIIVPNSLIGYLVDPDFNTFLLDTVEAYQYEEEELEMYGDPEGVEEIATNEEATTYEKLKGMILVLEDAEAVLLKREEGFNNQGTSNILNLTDGLLNDIFGIQIIATYNTGDEKIDDAIKRSKRLIAKRSFKALSLDATKKLAETIGVEKEEIAKIKKGKTVADVYALIEVETEDILIEKEVEKKGSVGLKY